MKLLQNRHLPSVVCAILLEIEKEEEYSVTDIANANRQIQYAVEKLKRQYSTEIKRQKAVDKMVPHQVTLEECIRECKEEEAKKKII